VCASHRTCSQTQRVDCIEYKLVQLGVAGCRVDPKIEQGRQQYWRGLSTRCSGAAAEHTPVVFGGPITHQVAHMLRSAKLGQRQPADWGLNTRTGSGTSRARHRQPSHPTVTAANGNGSVSGAVHHFANRSEAWFRKLVVAEHCAQDCTCITIYAMHRSRKIRTAVHHTVGKLSCCTCCGAAVAIEVVRHICCTPFICLHLQWNRVEEIESCVAQGSNSRLVVMMDCGGV
jgi:hypothetical protein